MALRPLHLRGTDEVVVGAESQAAKERGVKLGNVKLAQKNKQAAAARDAVLLPLLRKMSHLSKGEAAETPSAQSYPVNFETVQRMHQRHGLAE